MKKLTCIGCLLLLVCFAAGVVRAQGPVEVEVDGNTVSATIELPGGIAADFELAFEQAIGLSVASLGLSAELVNPLDSNLLSRLPDPKAVAVPAAFPVMVTVAPPATGGLSFTGPVSVDIHTHNLSYTANSPLRLFAAPPGGAFYDITVTTGMGSYRAGGGKGGFSDFLIVADTRPLDSVIWAKFDRLQNLLDAYSELIAPLTFNDLQAELEAAAWNWSEGGDPLAIIEEIDVFADTVEELSGSDIPDVWRSSRDLVNVGGYLRAGAATLRFSLSQKADSGS